MMIASPLKCRSLNGVKYSSGGKPCCGGGVCLAVTGWRHAVEHVLVRDDVERLQRILADQLRERLVAAHVIRMHVGIDDVANRAGRQLADLAP